jgi:hypothetical protein
MVRWNEVYVYYRGIVRKGEAERRGLLPPRCFLVKLNASRFKHIKPEYFGHNIFSQ